MARALAVAGPTRPLAPVSSRSIGFTPAASSALWPFGFSGEPLSSRRLSAAAACHSQRQPPPAPSGAATRLYVRGLSFRATEETLRNAFEQFGRLIDVSLVMDRVANRPRGYAFLCYADEEESRRAIQGMHGKFLDGRVIFVEVAKARSKL